MNGAACSVGGSPSVSSPCAPEGLGAEVPDLTSAGTLVDLLDEERREVDQSVNRYEDTSTGRRILECARNGQECRLGGSAPAEPEELREWQREREVPARFLLELLVEHPQELHAKGLRLSGAWITGCLDLEYARVDRPLELRDCTLAEPVVLRGAKAVDIAFLACTCEGIDAKGWR